MIGIISAAVASVAKFLAATVTASVIESVKDAAIDVAKDTAASAVLGKMSIEEWAIILSRSIDKVKDTVAERENINFIAGTMKFTMSCYNSDNVHICFELYFLTELQKWRKIDVNDEICTSKFTVEALEQLSSEGEIIYELE